VNEDFWCMRGLRGLRAQEFLKYEGCVKSKRGEMGFQCLKREIKRQRFLDIDAYAMWTPQI